MHAYRTHTCAQLSAENVGETVRLSGWIHRKRDHGGVLFIDLRDHYGLTQIVADEDSPALPVLEKLRAESVVTIDGTVKARTPETVNKDLPTGEIEVFAREITVQSAADELPMPVASGEEYPEHIRLKYRFLDLRRETMHRNIMLRSKVITSLRQRMIDQGFTEFQTPILTASSPEGARDFLVPSRMHPGTFYALPQAPQMFKQMLMVSGFDKYFQIAPCFRDEDLRADRSLEFYQLDFEMSFVTQEDVFQALEPVLAGTFAEFADGKTVTAGGEFPRIPYAEAMLKYGSDKPDLRNPIEIVDVSEVFRESGFGLFSKIVGGGGIVRAIRAPQAAATKSRKFFDDANNWARAEGFGGLAYASFAKPDWDTTSLHYIKIEHGSQGSYLTVQEDCPEVYRDLLQQLVDGGSVDKEQLLLGPVAKHLSRKEQLLLILQTGLEAGDGLFFAAGKESDAAKLAGLARTRVGEELDLLERNCFKFCWIVDFPMFEYDDEAKKIDFSHNPFSMPQGEMEALETMDPLEIKAWQYDIVCNGYELSSGAIRNHRPDIMYKAFEIAGYDKETVDREFAGMIEAFKLGAPPHGGSAPGIDRIVMLLAGEEAIREVIAFPMNQKGEDLMMGAPSKAEPKALRELHLRTVEPPQAKPEQAKAEG